MCAAVAASIDSSLKNSIWELGVMCMRVLDLFRMFWSIFSKDPGSCMNKDPNL
jgi:hypothetical protein